VTLWCQDVWGWSALRTGLGVAPGPLLVPFLAIAAGPIARRIGPGPVAAVGCAIYAGGCVFWRLNLSLAPDYPAHMLPGMLLTGIGVGLTLPTLVSAAVSAVPPNRFATGSGIVTMARQVGIVLGVAILVTVLGAHAAGDGALPAFQRATVVLAAAAAAAALVSLLLVWAGRRERVRPTVASGAEESTKSPVRSLRRRIMRFTMPRFDVRRPAWPGRQPTLARVQASRRMRATSRAASLPLICTSRLSRLPRSAAYTRNVCRQVRS